ncbi:Ca2+/calmodulin-dependent protein kinase [Trichoderma compactum]
MSELNEGSTVSASFVSARSHFSATTTTTCSHSSQWSSTQIEPRAIAVAEALGTRTYILTASQPSFGSATQIEPRIVAYEAALARKRDRQAQTLASNAPTVKQITTLLTRALSDVLDARMIVASTRFPNETNQNSSILPLSYKAKNRVMFGVVQQAQDVDLMLHLPFEKDYTTVDTDIKCQIVYNPGSDDCLLVNHTEPQLRLTNFSSSSNLQLSIMPGGSRFIQPGMWRISIASGSDDDEDLEEHHLAEFLLLGRQFNVSIHIANLSLKTKRGIDDDAEGLISKRQKRNDDVAETASVQPINLTAMEPKPVTTATEMNDAPDPSPSSPVQQSPDKTNVPLLDLADGQTAVVRAFRDRTYRSQSLSAATGPARYQLRRVKQIAVTKSAVVFACKHSAVSGPAVAKALQCNRDSPDDLRNSMLLWKREKESLEKLKHRNVIALRAFDGRMFAMYLEPLPPSLYQGQVATMPISDISRILYDISSALVYLKTVPMIHNDIKPLNITYSRRRGAVLIDFGSATAANQWSAGGTPWYLPPDLIHYNSRGSPGDIWALGITMLYLLGRIYYPEESWRGWPMNKLGHATTRKRMEDWLQHISTTRAKLDPVNMGTGRSRLECVVFRMLHDDSEPRIDAESIISILDPSM